MAGCHGLEHNIRFLAADFAYYEIIRIFPERFLEEVEHRDLADAGACEADPGDAGNPVFMRQRELSCIFYAHDLCLGRYEHG